MKILGDSQIPLLHELFSSLGEVHTYSGRTITPEQLDGVDALIVRSTVVVDHQLLKNTSIKFVGTCTIGTDHLHIDDLTDAGVKWANAAGCNADAVVQYVLSAMATLATNWLQSTVGIIGCGNIGGRLYQRLRALGVNCRVYDPFLSDHMNPDLMALSEVLQSDIVTCHAPLTTHGSHPSVHLLSRQQLKSLGAGTVLINAGRGAVIDNTALIERLQQPDAPKVVLDVWENEPNISDELLSLVDIATPHIAGHSLEGKERGSVMIYEALCDYLKNDKSSVSTQEQLLEAHRLINTEKTDLPLASSILDSTNNNSAYVLFNQCLLAAYPIMADDARLRLWHESGQELSIYFDQLRKHYPIRREYTHFHFPDEARRPPLSDWLALLTQEVTSPC